MIRAFAALALMAAIACVPAAQAQEAKMQRILTLTGHGEVRARPDQAIVNAGVMSFAATAREALDANNKSMTDILAALKAAGIADKDIQTSNFMVAPRYDYNQAAGQPPRVVGYDVSNTVAVTLRRLENLGAILDTLVNLGSNQINGIAFALDDPEPLRDEARKAAVADARRKAALYSQAAGVTLGQVIAIVESGGDPPPVPVFKSRMAAEGAAASVPVAEGEQSVSVDVAITWDIK